MTDPRQDNRNAAWQTAQQWRERTRQARPEGNMGGIRLVLAWLLFGVLMIVGTVLGLLFLLVGWAMLPFLRYRMKKQMERMRAERAEDINDGHAEPFRPGSQRVLEGDYEVKRRDRD